MWIELIRLIFKFWNKAPFIVSYFPFNICFSTALGWTSTDFYLIFLVFAEIKYILFRKSDCDKEYIERRHDEPFKCLILPKMGLLVSQAVLEKKVQFWIMSNFLAPFFQLFISKNLFFFEFFYIVASALKSCIIKKLKKIEKNLGSIFFGLKTGFFRASCFGLFWF